MIYVYGCTDKTHTRWTIPHSMKRNPIVICPVCGGVMHRVPQVTRFYINPGDVLMDKLDAKYRDYRARKKHATN